MYEVVLTTKNTTYLSQTMQNNSIQKLSEEVATTEPCENMT